MRKLMFDGELREPAAGAALDVALTWDVRIVEEAGSISLEGPETTVSLEGLDPARCRGLLDRLDGRHSMERLCEVSGLDEGACGAVVSCLVDSGLARRVPPGPSGARTLAGPRFAKVCRDLIPAWKNRLFGHSLWARLASGDAPRHLFLGWLLENYHLIEGATLRLSAAAAHCSYPKLRRHFIKHFAEEYDHCEFFRRALRACGMTNEDIDATSPLCGTLAVIHWARDAARTDPLAYAACSAFLESTGADRQSAVHFFERLGQSYDPGAIKHVAQHAQLDEAYGHAGFLEKICEDTGDIDEDRADRAIGYLRGFVETLELWSTAVERHYTTEAALRPGSVRVYGAAPGRLS